MVTHGGSNLDLRVLERSRTLVRNVWSCNEYSDQHLSKYKKTRPGTSNCYTNKEVIAIHLEYHRRMLSFSMDVYTAR